MKKLLVLALLFTTLAVIAQVPEPDEDPEVSFSESMNNDLFTIINQERIKNNLPELVYNFGMQSNLDNVAVGMKTKFCHCFGKNYSTEDLFIAPSINEVLADLKKVSGDNSVFKNKNITSIAVGISDDSEHYYYAIRTF